MTSRATIADVAEKARVSKVTVSYVLNGRSESARIRPETADRVREAAAALDYRPHPVARQLRTRRSNALALVFQYGAMFSAGSAFIGELMRGVCEEASLRGFDLVLHTRSTATPAEEVATLTDGRVDGVLVLRDGDDPVLRGLAAQTFLPVVSFFCAAGPAYVDADNRGGGALAVRHLAELGHRDLLFLAGSSGSVASNERAEGFREAAAELGLGAHVLPAFANAEVEASLKDRNGPTGVVLWSDDAALELLERLPALGLTCPGDLSVVGFDSLAPAARAIPPLTSVRQPVADMARAAVAHLAELVEGTAAPRTTRHPVTLDVRATTSLPRASARLSSLPSNEGTLS